MAGPGVETYRSLTGLQQVLLLAIVIGLVVGLAVAPFAWQATVEDRPDRVAVIPIVGVMDGSNTQDVVERLTRARQDPSIEAVVLLIDSPGGLAVDGEEIFLQVDRTAQEKPVVAAVNLQGASAGYKAMLPADEIIVKPASSVGSVGTILVRPQPIDPIEGVIETGPQKVDGDSPRGWEYRTQMVGNAFTDAVMEYRGEDLEITREEVAHARIYSGVEAVHLGLADDIGDLQSAVQIAADNAGLDGYEVTRMDYDTEVRFLDRAAYTASTQENKSMVTMEELVDTDGGEVVPTVLMLPEAALADLSSPEEDNVSRTNQSAVSHGGDENGD